MKALKPYLPIMLCLAFVAGCADSCKGKDGLLGPSGATGAPGTNGAQEITLAFEDYSSASDDANWNSVVSFGTPPTFSHARSSATFTSPGYSELFSTNLVNADSVFYRSFAGGSNTVCARFNTQVSATVPNSKFEFVIGNATNIIALLGYDPTQGSNKVYLREGSTVYPMTDFSPTWNTCEICVNLASGKSYYTLNGVNIGQGYSVTVPTSFSGQPASWFGLYLRTNSQAWTAYVDDLKIFRLQ